MKIATICLMTAMTVTLVVMSLVLLQELRRDPVGTEKECYSVNYEWEMGRIVPVGC